MMILICPIPCGYRNLTKRQLEQSSETSELPNVSVKSEENVRHVHVTLISILLLSW